MAISAKLELRQGQSLVMTPQLQQAIKMLQLSSLDLVSYVDAELEKNPLLERAETEAPIMETVAPEGASTESGQDGDGGGEDGWVSETVDAASKTIDETIDADREAVFPEDAPNQPETGAPSLSAGAADTGGGRGFDDGDSNLENFVSGEQTLTEHLQERLTLCRLMPAERLIAQAMIDGVDEAGYLTTDVAEIAGQLGAPLEMAEDVLTILQGFDPAGMFARDLAECLALQLKDRNRFDPAMEAMIGNLELLAKRDFGKLKSICGIDDEDLADMILEIRSLNPKPGLAFASEHVQPVVPDIMVRQTPRGDWHVELNSEVLPRVLVNQSYFATVSRSAARDDDKAYLNECLNSANWLVKSLEQRARTIMKVASEIIRQQDAFFAYGVTHLRPLNLKTVADAISMHESTVSRVTSNKYMATPRGIFELKYFFTAAIPAVGGGEAFSAEAVRHRIRELIDAERADAILSDDTIVQLLRDSGIDIARRTVAKYRESLRIPSSVQRRREKKAQAFNKAVPEESSAA
ncbi:MAG: RNA polymerase factor sigma-54 [Pseudomonadota bacterium]